MSTERRGEHRVAEGRVRGTTTSRIGLSVTLAVATVCVAAAIVLQTAVWRANAEFLVHPVSLGGGAKLVAVRLRDRVIHPSRALRVTLLINGPPPPSIDVLPVPAAFNAEPDPAPQLSEHWLDTGRLHALSLSIAMPMFARMSPGAYVLRIRGSSLTFGAFSIAATRT
jgi:hypothetical protein